MKVVKYNFRKDEQEQFYLRICDREGRLRQGRLNIIQVWKVDRKGGKQQHYLALKEMSKVKVYEKNSVASIINERKLLANLRHPFIINMHYAFQDRENLYIIMDYLSGGDLRYHICKQRKFDEEQTSMIILIIRVFHFLFDTRIGVPAL